MAQVHKNLSTHGTNKQHTDTWRYTNIDMWM